MENNTTSYPLLSDFQESSFGTIKTPSEGYTILISDSQNQIELKLSNQNVASFFERINFRNEYYKTSQHYCITAIRNLTKKNEFLQLSLQFSDNVITGEEYEHEIKNNSSKYLIPLSPLKNRNDILIISEIINKTGKEFTIDEVSEMFSIESSSLKESLSELNKRQ